MGTAALGSSKVGAVWPIFFCDCMNVANLTAHIEALIAPIVADLGMEVADVEFARNHGRWVLRLYVDFPQGGITIADCARVSRAVEGVLDVEGNIPGAYALEVSSPGLDRRLRTPGDFARFVGSVIDVKTVAPIEGRARYAGRLTEVVTDAVIVEVDGILHRLPLDQIAKAHLRAAWQPPQRGKH